MGLFSNLFSKADKQSVLSMWMPKSAPELALRDYIRAYARPWVNASVRAIATDVSTIELKLQQLQGDKWVDIQHECMAPLNRPNPRTTSDDLWFATEGFLQLGGEAFWYIAYSNGSATISKKPKELWLLDPRRMTINFAGDGSVASYTYRNDKGSDVKLEWYEVYHSHDFNPDNLSRGMGQVKPAASAIDIDEYASRHNRDTFYNSAIPGIILETEQELSDDQYERVEQKWLEKHQGLGKNGLPAVLEGGLKANRVALSPQELDFNEGKRLVRDETLAIFNVPKSVLGIVEDVNRASAEASEYVFASRVIRPRMRFHATRLTEFWLPLWGLDPTKYRVTFADPVPQNVELKAKVNDYALKSGWKSRNEIREEEGLKPVPGGEILLVPNNYVPLDLALNPPKPEPAPANVPTDKPQDEPKKALDVAKGTDEYSVDKRIAYFYDQIAKGTTTFKGHITARKDELLKGLEEAQKGLTKADGDDEGMTGQAELETILFASWEAWTEALSISIIGLSTETLVYAGKRTLALAGLDAAFDSTAPQAVAWLRQRGLQSATEVAETLKGEIRRILIEGVEQGKSVDAIAKDIGQFFDDSSQWRAARIARTEVMTAYGEGSIEAARQGKLDEKSWHTAGDDRVSDICLANEAAGWINREDAFPSGHMAPTSHPNCRCDVQFRAQQNI